LASLAFLFVPEVEIHSERPRISDDRRDRRKIAMGPSPYPAKRVPELKKRWEPRMDSGGECIEGDESY
jgi:hypothetical protein